ncbi:MAG: hypothetical protein OXC92_00515 [Flavobacteriaceae bacterium]|nr:hypothetical protein [Flavobacteriaceae bacterium]
MMVIKKKGFGLIILLISTINFGQTTDIKQIDISKYRCIGKECIYLFRAKGIYDDIGEQNFIIKVRKDIDEIGKWDIDIEKLFEISDDVIRNYNSFWRRYYREYYKNDPKYRSWVEAIGSLGLSIIQEIYIYGVPKNIYTRQEYAVGVKNVDSTNRRYGMLFLTYEYGSFNLSKSIEENRANFLED